MIEVKQLSKSFGVGADKVTVVEDMSFSVAEGEFVSIIGPSGCGKTTLIKIVGDLEEPTSGSVVVNGKSNEQARIDKMFSFVFQKPVLLPWRTVFENIQLPLEIVQGNSRSPADLLKMVGLEDSGSLHPHELSGGMAQRVALARGLSFDPKILLMDEPFSAVDEFTRATLNHQLIELWKQIKVTVLFITHSISEALFLSDRVFVLSSRPAKIDYDFTVPFERPRDNALRETKEFQEIVRCLRSRLE